MSAATFDIDQLNSCFSGEFGISAQHFDCERDHIDNTLSWAMAATKKLKIGQRIILPVAIDVMHRFFGKKIAPKMLGHDPSVFHNLPLLSVVKIGGDADPDVAVLFDMSLTGFFRKSPSGLSHLPSYLTSLITKALLPVVNGTSSSLVSAHLIDFAALFADKSAACHCVSSSAFGRTGNGAVERVFAKFLTILSQIGWFVSKGMAAGFTGKHGLCHFGGGATMGHLVSFQASSSAETLVAMRWFNKKCLSTIVANFLNAYRFGHQHSPRMDNTENTVFWRAAQVAL